MGGRWEVDGRWSYTLAATLFPRSPVVQAKIETAW